MLPALRATPSFASAVASVDADERQPYWHFADGGETRTIECSRPLEPLHLQGRIPVQEGLRID